MCGGATEEGVSAREGSVRVREIPARSTCARGVTVVSRGGKMYVHGLKTPKPRATTLEPGHVRYCVLPLYFGYDWLLSACARTVYARDGLWA